MRQCASMFPRHPRKGANQVAGRRGGPGRGAGCRPGARRCARSGGSAGHVRTCGATEGLLTGRAGGTDRVPGSALPRATGHWRLTPAHGPRGGCPDGYRALGAARAGGPQDPSGPAGAVERGCGGVERDQAGRDAGAAPAVAGPGRPWPASSVLLPVPRAAPTRRSSGRGRRRPGVCVHCSKVVCEFIFELLLAALRVIRRRRIELGGQGRAGDTGARST